MARPKVELKPQQDQLVAQDQHWLTLGELRELVKQADANGWSDGCLVGQDIGAGEHPTLKGVWRTRYLVVQGPT